MAAWSCLGFIIGLGDRHLGNLMLNLKTGEINHIDFDMIFNLGSHLGVREIVPFRLTNNFEQALGVSGTNGLFLEYFKKFAKFFQKYKDIIYSMFELYYTDPIKNTGKGDKNNTYYLFSHFNIKGRISELSP